MPQPPAYDRAKDFTEDFGSETDHSALNGELDKASNSINDIRTNLAILQADDGKLNPDVITADSISVEVRNELSQGIIDQTQGSVDDAAASAVAAAASETNLANAVTITNANKIAAAESEAAALISRNAADADALSTTESKNIVVAAESNVVSLAGSTLANKNSSDVSAAAALISKNAAANSAVSTAADAVATAADRVQTGLDRASATASRNATAADAIAVAATAASFNDANILHKTGNETKSGVLTLTNSPIIPNAVANDEPVALGQLTGRALSAGTVFDFAGTTAPYGSLACPLAATNISRTAYAKLFAALGTTWGAGDGSTTFGMPWFPENQVGVQANGNVGTTTVGENLAHTHAVAGALNTSAGSGNFSVPISSTKQSGSSGGTANLPAGNRVLKCVQYL